MPSDTIDTALDEAVARAQSALLRRQKPDGHWVFELEADATIPAEYVLLEHYLDRIEPELERRIGTYLRATQGAHGGWPLFHDGAFNISASVKAYFALKMLGDDPDAPHMRRARDAILAAGGAERSNVFTRAQLALYGEVPWRAVPVMPVELVLLPRWFPFHLDKVSYWSRTVIVPLTVLMALRPRARNPRGIHIPELFATPPAQVRDWIRGPFRSGWGHFFRHLDGVLRAAQPLFPAVTRKRAIRYAVDFVTERLNGEDGLGAIYPAMANTVMMFDTLGYAPDHPDAAIAWAGVRKLLVVEEDRAYCQPCLSPVWDTGLAGHAVAEADSAASPEVAQAAAWLRGKQVLDVVGDWARARPDAPPGGWAFQYANPHYPDVDDTAVVGMLLHRHMQAGGGDPAHAEAIARARDWIIGMQSKNGGWGAFDADNDKMYLNHIPFADHGALLDPPTADVTARCVSFLAQTGMGTDHPVLARALSWLKREQMEDGS
ncbi:MAG TPA: squalene--hopene cyclase, partial [Acetobacteraceae bacterium]|nr:squalene--hopene cyclase [Acetobacteraceae bacterium]